jgi:hypothetical protein
MARTEELTAVLRRSAVCGATIIVLAVTSFVVARVVSNDGDTANSSSAMDAASTRWPVETLRDWSDFADQLAIIRIEAETKLAPSASVLENGEGLIPRNVRVRIEETLWRNPGSPRAEDVITFGTWGWVVHDGNEVPAVDETGVRLAVGDRVLAPLLLTPEGSWAPLSPGSVLPLTDGLATFAAAQRSALPELAKLLHRRTPQEVASILAAVPPRPNAAALRQLDPDARALALAKER